MPSKNNCRFIGEIQESLGYSARRFCRMLEKPRSTQGFISGLTDSTAQLTERIIELALRYGRYGNQGTTDKLRRWLAYES